MTTRPPRREGKEAAAGGLSKLGGGNSKRSNHNCVKHHCQTVAKVNGGTVIVSNFFPHNGEERSYPCFEEFS